MSDLAANPDYAEVKEKLEAQMIDELKKQGDPRMFGRGYIFDQYEYADPQRDFYERYMSGEKLKAGWVNPSDFEKEPLD
jgi:hypothetical protein